MNLKTKNWLVNLIVEKELKIIFKKYASGVLLDIGCGKKPYEQFLKNTITKHIGLDYQNSPYFNQKTDKIGTAYETAFPNEHFNTILCTAVLEHLEEPDMAIKEGYRILKYGGYAIYTVPLFWHLHDHPRDFFRYTKYGLKYLFEKNNFKIVSLKPLSGFWVTFTQEFSYYLSNISEKLKILKYPLRISIFFLQLMGFLLNKIDNSHNFTWMYLLVVKK